MPNIGLDFIFEDNLITKTPLLLTFGYGPGRLIQETNVIVFANKVHQILTETNIDNILITSGNLTHFCQVLNNSSPNNYERLINLLNRICHPIQLDINVSNGFV